MENIKEKIQKLLNLATSDNEYEAALALTKATELMNKWNLDKGSVLGTNIEKVERELPFYKWTSENQVLVNLLTRLCDGFCLYVNGNKKANKFAKILISGRPRDLENFGYLYDFINTKLVRTLYVKSGLVILFGIIAMIHSSKQFKLEHLVNINLGSVM